MSIGHSSVIAMACMAALAGACDQLSTEKPDQPEHTQSTSQPVESETKPKPTTESTKPAPATDARPFEGVIQLVFEYPNKKSNRALVYRIKGDRVQYAQDAPGGTGVLDVAVFDAKTNVAYALDEGQRRYTQLKTKAEEPGGKSENGVMTRTNKTETIEGMPCELWHLDSKDGDEHVDAWVAPGTPYFVLSESAKPVGAQPWWAATLSQNRAFPLRLIARDKEGHETFRAQAKAVDAKKLDDSMFTVPGNYTLIPDTAGVKLPGVS